MFRSSPAPRGAQRKKTFGYPARAKGSEQARRQHVAPLDAAVVVRRRGVDDSRVLRLHAERRRLLAVADFHAESSVLRRDAVRDDARGAVVLVRFLQTHYAYSVADARVLGRELHGFSYARLSRGATRTRRAVARPTSTTASIRRRRRSRWTELRVYPLCGEGQPWFAAL